MIPWSEPNEPNITAWHGFILNVARYCSCPIFCLASRAIDGARISLSPLAILLDTYLVVATWRWWGYAIFTSHVLFGLALIAASNKAFTWKSLELREYTHGNSHYFLWLTCQPALYKASL